LAKVFAQHMVNLPYRSGRIVALVSAPQHHWTIALEGSGHEHLASVGVRIGQVPLYKHVKLTLGKVPEVVRGNSVMLPVSWEAVGGPALFPRMEGTLHISPEEDEVTRLTLNACYEPPLGPLGEVLDRALLRHLAQATIKNFVVRLAASLEAELAALA
jgi:hypothetical protein